MAHRVRQAQVAAGREPAWPLVGRQEELDFLRAARRRRPPVGTVVSGLPGVGKSRLVEAALRGAEADGFGVVAVRASAGLRHVAFAPFRSVIDLPASSDPAELVAAVERALDKERDGGVLLVVDDAHDLDEASAGLVHHLAAVDAATVVVTVRTGAARPEAVTSLWKDGLAERVELEGLSRAETAELVGDVLSGTVEDATVERIWHLTDGNPLYVREVLLSAREAGVLRRGDDSWHWHGRFTSGLRLRELVAERLGRLAPDELSAVELLSLAGSLPVKVLSSLASERSIGDLEARALVTVERSDRRREVRLGHPLYGEVVRAGLPSLRAQSMRRRLTEALEHTGARRSADRVSLAVWSVEAGIPVDAATLTQIAEAVLWHPSQEISNRLEQILAGTLAGSGPDPSVRELAQGDPALAVRLARAAYDASGSVAAGAALATTLCWAGETHEAARVLADLQATAATAEDRLTLALALADVRFWGEHDHESAIGALRGAIARDRAGGDRALLAAAIEKLAGVELNTDRPAAALAHCAEASALIGEELACSFAAPAAAASLSHLGRCDEALELVDRALPVALAQGRHSLEVPQLLFARCGTLARTGRLEEAQALAESCQQVALSIDSLDGTALFGLSAAEALLRQGRPASAARQFRDAVGLLHDRDLFGYLPWALAGLARARALLGDEEAAALAWDAATKACRGRRFFDVFCFEAGAAVQRLAGREVEALRLAADGAARAREAGLPVEEAMCLHAAVRISPAPGLAARLEQLTAATDSGYVALLARHGAARVDGDGDGLLELAEAFAAISARFAAAEAAAAAAELYERRRLERAARAAARTALTHLAACEGARSPLTDRLGAPSVLTRREHEVAVLAAAGHASREIAGRLQLSTRTVDSHLYRAYTKLGVSSRVDLAAALRPPEPPARGRAGDCSRGY